MYQKRIIILISLSLMTIGGCAGNTGNSRIENKEVQYETMKVENAPQEVKKEESALKIDTDKKEPNGYGYKSKSDFEKHMEQLDRKRR